MSRPRKTKAVPTLSEELRATVVNCGLTHYRLAKQTGISQPIITRFANGDRSISLETADKLAAFFQMSLSAAVIPSLD